MQEIIILSEIKSIGMSKSRERKNVPQWKKPDGRIGKLRSVPKIKAVVRCKESDSETK